MPVLTIMIVMFLGNIKLTFSLEKRSHDPYEESVYP